MAGARWRTRRNLRRAASGLVGSAPAMTTTAALAFVCFVSVFLSRCGEIAQAEAL